MCRIPRFTQLCLTLIALTILGLPGLLSAQSAYKIHTWISFEEGRLPDNLIRFHQADEKTVQVVDITSAGFPPDVTAGIAGLECGRYGVFWRPDDANQRHLSIFGPDGLDRSRLGQSGRALYQADFYLPAEGYPIPNISLLAQVLPASENESKYHFYRFGILEPGDKVFFSFTSGNAKPDIFEQQQISELNLKRPGWHRFQIIFVGSDQIYCAIDGQPTSFSPITEGTHRRLNAGIMVTRAEIEAVALTDNLSIQWTAEDSPLPQSPWTIELPTARVANRTPLETGAQVIWLNDPQQAWTIATRQKRPLLVMFFIPDIGPYRYLQSIVPNNNQAYQLLNQYVLLRIDANQLYGGRLAEKFDIFRLPTFAIMSPDGQIKKRVTVVTRQTTWDDLRKELDNPIETPTPGPGTENGPSDTETGGDG